MNISLFLLAGATMSLTGCASQIGAFFNRPVVQDQVPGLVSTFAQTADRRTVIVGLDGVSRGKVCAEPPPDSATGLKTNQQLAVEAPGRKLNVGDQLETSITVLSERTPNLDAFRTGVYYLCQFNLNGAISNAEAPKLFETLIQRFAEVEIATAQGQSGRVATNAIVKAPATAPSSPVTSP